MVRKSSRFDTLYMLVWSYAEIKAARSIYPDVEVALAKELFDRFGGVVRYSDDIAIKLHAQQDFLLQYGLVLQGCPGIGQEAWDFLAD